MDECEKSEMFMGNNRLHYIYQTFSEKSLKDWQISETVLKLKNNLMKIKKIVYRDKMFIKNQNFVYFPCHFLTCLLNFHHKTLFTVYV